MPGSDGGEAMSSISSLMSIAVTGLDAAQAGLSTTGNNIANANSPGYSRETVQQAPQVPAGQDGVVQGTGVMVTGVRRSYSQFAETRLWQANAAASSAQQLQSVLDQLNNVMSGSGSSLTGALNGFFQAAQTLAGNPSGTPERQALLSAASTLSGKFNSLGGEIVAQRANLSQQIGSTVGQINTLTTQIARLNVEIGASSGNTSGNPPNGLMDQRDHLVTQLNKLVGVSVTRQQNGAFSVFTANGQALVTGAKSYRLGTQPNALNARNLDVVYEPSGAVMSNGIRGGALGGLFAGRNQLEQAQNSLGRLATVLSSTVNLRQSLGLDANGQLGRPMFSLPAPSVQAASDNTGSAALTASVSDATALTGDQYQLRYQGGAWVASTYPGGSSVTVSTSGSTLSFGGLSINVSGTPASGDRFLVSPGADAASGIRAVLNDPAGIAAAAPYVSGPGAVGASGLVDNNTGNVAVSQGQSTTAPTSGATLVPATAFGQMLQISFTSPTSYQVSDPSGVVASGTYSTANGASIAVAYPSPPGPAGTYWQVGLSGNNPQAGDSYVLQPSGPGDNRNANALGALGQSPVVGGKASLSQGYATLTGTIGNAGQQAGLSATATQASLAQAQQSQQSVSGVNLNEEAASLVQYQQAFQAAAKSVGIAEQMFQSILSL